MTPLMTPSSLMGHGGHMATPVGGPAATPSYQPTPRGMWPGATPRTPAARTPALLSRTPGHNAPTPLARTPSRTPSRIGASPAVGKSTVGTDWARAAELWAKQRQTEITDLGGTPRGSTPGGGGGGTPRAGTPRGGTPRSGKSPRVAASPAPVASTSYDRYGGGRGGGGDSPQGDGTPLIDER